MEGCKPKRLRPSDSVLICRSMAQELSLAEVRARRKALAQEDGILAGIEKRLLEATNEWERYVAAHAQHSVGSANQMVGGGSQTMAGSVRVTTTSPVSVKPGKPPTKINLMISALTAPRPLWQSANQIQAYMEKQLGKPVPMSSVSPALTALKNNGTIVRNELSVALVLRVETEEPQFLKAIEPPEEVSSNGSTGDVAVQH